MIDERTLELIHGEIDRSNTRRQSRKLEQRMAENPEVRAYFDEMREICGLLNSAAHSEPPTALKTSILNSIPTNLYRTQSKSRDSFAHAFVPTMTVKIGYAFVAVVGVILGVLFYRGAQMHTTGVVGTMVSPSLVTSTVPAAELPISIQGATGLISFRSSNQYVLGSLRISCREHLTLTLNYQGEGVDLASISRPGGNDAPMRVEGKSLIIDLSGENDYTLVFQRSDRSPARMSIHLRNNQSDVWQQDVTIDG